MTKIIVTERKKNASNLLYIQTTLSELFSHANCKASACKDGERAMLKIDVPDCYADIIKAEIADRAAEVAVINYKYDFFQKNVGAAGLNSTEREILLASLIAADFDEDKKYAIERYRNSSDLSIDGVYRFRMRQLTKKWADIASYMPPCFLSPQLKDFVGYLLENKKKRVYIDNGRVYDCHYKRLKRCALLGGDVANVVREVLLSNCGEVEICGKIPEEDEYYLKEFYADKIIFSTGYFA